MRGLLRTIRRWMAYARPVAPPSAVDFHLHSVTVPITIPITSEPGDVVSMLERKYEEAARNMEEYLSTLMWVHPPWYRVAWNRIRGAALVLAGRRYAVTEAVAFHTCDDREDIDE